jgi:integrase/recombinase XerC
MTEIAILPKGTVAEFSFGQKVSSAIDLWLAGLSSEGTRKAYEWELQQFATFAKHADASSAMVQFLKLKDGQAHAVADAWRAHKINAGRSPASVNRSMATLNSFVASAKRHGLTELSLKAKAEKSQRYRDTRGCGLGGVQKLITEAQNQDPRKAARDAAILRLAFGLGLRRNEIASLDIGHVDGDKLHILGKGSRERIALTLPKNAKDALAVWLAHREGDGPEAPLFINLAHNSSGNRISGAGVYHLIRDQLGKRANVGARPHGLRHAAITAALDAFQGDYRKARSFSRHASLETVRRYDDNRADHAGQVAAVVDGLAA